jgi:hypothetical protein
MDKMMEKKGHVGRPLIFHSAHMWNLPTNSQPRRREFEIEFINKGRRGPGLYARRLALPHATASTFIVHLPSLASASPKWGAPLGLWILARG